MIGATTYSAAGGQKLRARRSEQGKSTENLGIIETDMSKYPGWMKMVDTEDRGYFMKLYDIMNKLREEGQVLGTQLFASDDTYLFRVRGFTTNINIKHLVVKVRNIDLKRVMSIYQDTTPRNISMPKSESEKIPKDGGDICVCVYKTSSVGKARDLSAISQVDYGKFSDKVRSAVDALLLSRDNVENYKTMVEMQNPGLDRVIGEIICIMQESNFYNAFEMKAKLYQGNSDVVVLELYNFSGKIDLITAESCITIDRRRIVMVYLYQLTNSLLFYLKTDAATEQRGKRLSMDDGGYDEDDVSAGIEYDADESESYDSLASNGYPEKKRARYDNGAMFDSP